MAFKVRTSGGTKPLPTAVNTATPTDDVASLLSKIEQEEGIPSGRLVALAKTESGLDPQARNPRSSATGLFQFIDSTGQEMGLVGDDYDYRTDPEKSARAAAQMLKRNTEALGGDWDMGIQAHHTGLGGVQKYGGPDPTNPESVNYLTQYKKNFQPPVEEMRPTPLPPAKPGRKRMSAEEAKEYMANLKNSGPAAVQEAGAPGWWSNTARGAAERGVALFGEFLGAIGQAGEAVSNITGTFDTSGKYLTPNEVREAKAAGAPNVLDIAEEKVQATGDFGYEENTSWQDLKDAYDEGGLAWLDDLILYGGEQGLKSVPDMVAVVANMPAYIMTRAREIGGERAQNKGKERQTLADTWEALPFATGSAVLERIGAKGISQAAIPDKIVADVGKAGIKEAVKRGAKDIGKAGSKEAATEAVQEGALEYLGEKAGTGAEMSLAEALDRAAAGSVAGGTFGASAATPGTVITELRRPVTKDTKDKINDIKITPAARQQLAEEEAAAGVAAPAPTMKAEINEQDIADNIEIAAQVMATGDEVRAQKLSDDLTEAYGPYTAKAILTRAGKQVVKQKKAEAAPEATPAPEVAPVPEGAPEPVTPVVGGSPVAQPVIPVDDKPALTPAAATMSSAINNILAQENALRGNEELGEKRAPLDDRITAADDLLALLAQSLPTLTREGYRTQPVWDVIRKMPGAKISKRGRASKQGEMVDRVGKTAQTKFIGKEVAKLGEALRRAQYRADGSSRGVVTHARLDKLVDALTAAYEGILDQGPVGAPKRVREATGTVTPITPAPPRAAKPKAKPEPEPEPEPVAEPTPVEVSEGQQRREKEEAKRVEARTRYEAERREQIKKAHEVKAEQVAKVKKKVSPRAKAIEVSQKRSEGKLKLKKPVGRRVVVPTPEVAPTEIAEAPQGSSALKTKWIASGVDITPMSDKQMEEDHSWVQRAFPNGKPSVAQPSTQWMNREQAAEVKRLRPKLEKEMDANADRYAKFLDDNPDLTKPGNHNAKRVSRVLESLSMFGFNELAQDYAENFKDIYQVHGNLTPALRDRWDSLVQVAQPLEDTEIARKNALLDEVESDIKRGDVDETVQDKVDDLLEQSDKIDVEDVEFDAKFRAVTKQMQDDFAEYGKKGDRLVFFVHATDRILGDKVMEGPRTGRPENSTDNRPYFYTTMDPKDARDYARHHGLSNPAIIVYGIPKSRVDKLEASQNIKYSQNSWSVAGKKFTEFKLTDRALVEIEDARRVADEADAANVGVPEGSKIVVNEGRDQAATLMDQTLLTSDTSTNQLMQMMVDTLDSNDPYVPILQAILAKNLGDIDVMAVTPTQMGTRIGNPGANGAYMGGYNKKTKQPVRRVLMNDAILDTPQSVKTFVHEMVHAATLHALRTDNKVALEIAALRRYVVNTTKGRDGVALDWYGLTNVDEFVAEAMSNPQFQAFLARIDAPNGKSAWTKFVELVRKYLGMDIPSDSVLSNVMSLVNEIMLTNTDIEASMAEVRTGQAEYISRAEERAQDEKELEQLAASGMLFDESPVEIDKRAQALDDNAEYVRVAMHANNSLGGATQGATQAFNTPAKSAVDRVSEDVASAASPAVLGMMTGDAIDSYAREDFKHTIDGEQLDPLGDYTKAKMREQAESRTLDREAEALNATWTKVFKKYTQYKDAFDNMVLESTMFQVDPSVAWVHPKNNVTRNNKQRSKTAQEAHRRLRLQYLSMPAPVQNLYTSAASFYRDTYLKMREQIIDNVLDMYDVTASPRLRQAIIASRTRADLDAIVPPMVTRKVGGKPVRVPLPSWDKAVKVFKDLDQVMNNNGPYFPQMRFGDHAIEYTKARTSRVYASKAAAETAARAYRANNPGSKTKNLQQVSKGKWTFDTLETGFSLYETLDEARTAQAELAKEGFDVSDVAKRSDITFSEDSTAGRILSVANNKLKGPGAERSKQALHEALVTMLPETSMQKRMLKRKNIRGASLDSQRVFANYAQSAGHHLAKLKYRKDVETSFNQIMNASKNIARQGTGDTARTQKVGNVANEIQKRHNKVDKAGGLSRVAAKLGFLGYLFSLSYSAVNATQPLLMTIPYLSGKYSGAKATAGLAKAYSQVGGEVARSAVKNIGGLKGLIPGQTIDLNELTNNIIDNLRSSNPDAARMLNELADLGTLDATFALEISEMAKSKGGPVGRATDKAVEIGRVLPYTIEIMNRATTAVAAYNLAAESGVEHAAAVEQAREAIVKTQFDYTMENRPRYFKANELAKVATMFKIHPLGVYSFLITQTRKMARTPQERNEAARSLRWFLYTHAAFAGVAGSLLMEPIRAALGLVDLLFGDDDEDDWLSNPDLNMRDMVYENLVDLTDPETASKVAEVFVRGLPRAAGFDMSSRVGVENLMIMWQQGDTVWQSLGTSIEKSLVGPIFGASDGISRGISHAVQGGGLGKSLEYVAPKGIRDFMRAYRYATEGMTDFRGNVIQEPEKFSNVELAAKAFGFATSTESETFEKREIIKKATTRVEDKRRALVRKYTNASTEDRAAVREEINNFNDNLPADLKRSKRIQQSTLIKARQQRRTRERDTKEGIYLPRDQRRVRERIKSFQ